MKSKLLLLVSALSLLPLTSMGADVLKAPNPATGVVTGYNPEKEVTSTAPSSSQLKTGGFTAASNPSSKGSGGNGGNGGTGASGGKGGTGGVGGAFTYTPTTAATQKGSTAPSGAIAGSLVTPTPPPSGGTDSFTVTTPAPSGSYGGGIQNKK
jgi:hypothetical protein